MEKSPNPSGFPSNPNDGMSQFTQEKINDRYVQEGLERQEGSFEEVKNGLKMGVPDSDHYYIDKEYMDCYMIESFRKIDATLIRLSAVEMKMDMKMKSKPGFKESVAIGVASGIAVKGIGNVFQHVVAGIGQIWNSVNGSTKS